MKPLTSFSYQIEVIRSKNIELIRKEYLNFIGILYRDQIESGVKQVKDFKDMTMYAICEEIELRTKIITADNQRKARRQKEEQQKKEQALLAYLKNIQ